MNVSKNFLLIRSSALLRKRVVRISCPSSRKIAAIVGVGAPGHSDFVAVVQLGNATQCHGQPERQFQLAGELPSALAKRVTSWFAKKETSASGCGHKESCRNTSAMRPTGAFRRRTSRSLKNSG